MDARKLVQGIVKNYYEEVKPLIEQENYMAAKMVMGNYVFAVDEDIVNISIDVPKGVSFVASLKSLRDSLDSNASMVERAVQRFEDVCVQTDLPLKKDLD